jgi:hypothetical protein
MKKLSLLLIIISILMSGCIQQTIMIKKNTTGTINYKIIYGKDYISYINSHDKSQEFDIRGNILFNKTILQRTIDNTTKMKLTDFSEITDKDSNKNYNITIDFEDIENLTKKIKPLFYENSIYPEKDNFVCQTRLTLNSIIDPKKIKDQLNVFSTEEKTTLLSYLELVKIKTIVIVPTSILTLQTTNEQDKTTFFTEPVESYPANTFENDILNKIVKKEDKDKLLSLYKKDKLKNIYIQKTNIDEEDKTTLSNLMSVSGIKNKVVYEYTLTDLINREEKGIEIAVYFKKTGLN